jgi:hypothetical protein
VFVWKVAIVIEGYITEGHFFGDVEFYLGSTNITTYRADSHCQMMWISYYSTIENLCRHYPKVGEYFATLFREHCLKYEAVIRSNVELDMLTFIKYG